MRDGFALQKWSGVAITAAACGAVAVALGWGLAHSGGLVAVVLLMCLASAVVISRPMWAIVALILATFSVDWLRSQFPGAPASVSLIEEVVLICLLATISLHVGRRRSWRATAIDKWVLILIVASIVGTAVNTLSPEVALVGVRNYWKFVVLMYACVQLEFSEKQLRVIVTVAFAMSLFQVPVSVLQRLASLGRTGDSMAGTLGVGASGYLTILMLGMIAMALGWYLYAHRRSQWNLVLVAILIVPAAINETKVLFFAGPLLLSYLLWSNVRGKLVRVLLASIVATTLLLGAYQTYAVFYGSRGLGQSLFSKAYLVTYLGSRTTKAGTLNRLPVASFAIHEVARHPYSLLFGFGPGAASESALGEGKDGPVYRRYAGFSVDSSFASRFTLEYGVVGWLALVGLLVSLARTARRVRRSALDAFWRGAALGLEGWTLLMLGLAVYTSTFVADVLGLCFWLLAGMVIRVSLMPDASSVACLPNSSLRT